MKNSKNTLFIFSTILVGFLILFACNKDEINESNIETFDSSYSKRVFDRNSLSIEISEELYDLKYFANGDDDEVNSELTVFHNNDSLFSITYNFNTKEEHWRLKQAPIIINKSDDLKSKSISESILSDISDILTETIGYVYYETVDNKNLLVISSINYHKSIINAVLRAYSANSTCDCTVHPEFILDKTFFNCQEEHFYDTSSLRSILYDYVAENSLVDSNTLDLISFLDTYTEETIRFDDYYSFYVDRSDFELFVSNMITSSSGGCGWWCVLGCGSDHGCCGNYSGCCLYWHPGCYVHDKMCTDCKPEWFCLPGCKPDKPSTSFQISIN